MAIHKSRGNKFSKFVKELTDMKFNIVSRGYVLMVYPPIHLQKHLEFRTFHIGDKACAPLISYIKRANQIISHISRPKFRLHI